MLFSLYFGKKHKLINLANSYFVDGTLMTKKGEPLTLEITFDLNELKRQGSDNLINYLLDYKTEMILEIDTGIKLGYANQKLTYLFAKNHNQAVGSAFIGKNGENWVYVNGTEKLPKTTFYTEKTVKRPNYQFNAQENIITVQGDSKIVFNSSLPANGESQTQIDYRLFSNVESSQNMINALQQEQLSIQGQVLQDNLLTITLFSSLNFIDYSKTNINFGRTYNMPLGEFVKLLLPSFQVIVANAYDTVNYTVELKTISEILKDVMGSKNIILDNGYDIKNRKRKLYIFDTTEDLPVIRCINSQHQQTNPYIINIKENFPTISASVELNGYWIREAQKVLIDWSNSLTAYRGEFVFEGTKINLLEGYKDGNTNVTLSYTNLDVRRNILTNNLTILSNNRL
jgi:hypothetical protein